ncbi:MAG: hypothetical protein CML19_18285 [Pusillimonas sp.]|nr:hypothetical protein [Pusillimonas sp.]|tara:strand:- start:580 stop:1086 length:507 start_codon:yes stop_codon:yes gene_type:complete
MTTVTPIRLIKETVAQQFGTSVTDIDSARRDGAVVVPRHVAIWLVRHLTHFTTTVIGREFGDRDHTTIVSALSSIDSRMAEDPRLQNTVQDLRDLLAPQILDFARLQRASRLVLNRFANTEDVLRHRIDNVFAIIAATADERPFAVLEELELAAQRLSQPRKLAEAAE